MVRSVHTIVMSIINRIINKHFSGYGEILKFLPTVSQAYNTTIKKAGLSLLVLLKRHWPLDVDLLSENYRTY